MATKSALEQIADIHAEAAAKVAKLKEEALKDLKEKLRVARADVNDLENQIQELTGKAPRKTGKGGGGGGLPDVPTASILKGLLSKAEGKTLNRAAINAAGYSLKSALAIAKADPKTFSHTQNKAQGTVTLK